MPGNIFLTVNALFIEIQEVLGHGRTPSLLNSAIRNARLSQWADLKGMLGKIRLRTHQFEDKLHVWQSREELDELTQSLVDNHPDLLMRARLQGILSNPLTLSPVRAPETWDRLWD